MKNDFEFIKLILDCEHLINQNTPSNPEDAKRYKLMLDELKGLKITIKLKQLSTRLNYLSITQMLEKDDPEEILYAILKLNKFYCTYYQIL
ncbi:hypothetical protein C5137_28970 [Bacillus cereus]|uniref:hypothetical protein n=1 Tax=Bacillus TaxID=1386 RepID=UPI001F5CDEF7|nr:hypothetical protein [Bacillus cereus]MCI3150109.1 hypothetical protein [Bacillus cereus]WHS75971.1 hypothetical protein OF864_00885 [Bacillus cereus]